MRTGVTFSGLIRELVDKINGGYKKYLKVLVRTGTRTQNLLLRRQAPYPLGHTDNYEFCLDHTPSRTRHSSLGVEHSLSKRKVVGSNPACGFQLLFVLVFCFGLQSEDTKSLLQLGHSKDSSVRVV